MVINDIPLATLKDILAADTPLAIETTEALIDRLEQAEQDRVKLRNRLDAMRRQRDGYRNQLRKTEQAVARVRTELGYIPESFSARIYKALDGDTRG